MARTSPEELKATKLELLRIVQSEGSSIATGETAPDFPTCHLTSSSFVTTPSCFSLRAKAPRG